MVVQDHDHACLIYATPEQQQETLARAMSEALARGDRFLYLLDQDAETGVLEALESAGVDVEDALDDGALVVKSTSETYLQDGVFDPDRMIELLREAEREALEDGFRGLAGAGEMTWATRGAPGSERLLEYERKLNEVLPRIHVGGICQYDARSFDPDVLAGVLRAHPLVVAHGAITRNPYFEAETPMGSPPSS